MDKSLKALGTAVVLQAVRDYMVSSPQRQKVIIKDLKSEWVDFLTDGMSVVAAEQLLNNPEKISATCRLRWGDN